MSSSKLLAKNSNKWALDKTLSIVGKPRTVCGLTMAECIGDYVATSLAAVAEAA